MKQAEDTCLYGAGILVWEEADNKPTDKKCVGCQMVVNVAKNPHGKLEKK